jgi:hypothetical protein
MLDELPADSKLMLGYRLAGIATFDHGWEDFVAGIGDEAGAIENEIMRRLGACAPDPSKPAVQDVMERREPRWCGPNLPVPG